MPTFSARSAYQLSTAHPDLQRLFNAVIAEFDCTVIEGHRGEVEQTAAFRTGHSKVQWPNGKHNSLPSRAVDVAPYPINWHDTPRFKFFAAEVLRIARDLNIGIRWGGDWDGNPATPNRFNDLVHWELL